MGTAAYRVRCTPYWRTKFCTVLHHDTDKPFTRRVVDDPGRQTLRSAPAPAAWSYRLSNSTVGSRAFPVAVALMWNASPEDMISASTLQLFQQRLKTFLFQHLAWRYDLGHFKQFVNDCLFDWSIEAEARILLPLFSALPYWPGVFIAGYSIHVFPNQIPLHISLSSQPPLSLWVCVAPPLSQPSSLQPKLVISTMSQKSKPLDVW